MAEITTQTQTDRKTDPQTDRQTDKHAPVAMRMAPLLWSAWLRLQEPGGRRGQTDTDRQTDRLTDNRQTDALVVSRIRRVLWLQFALQHL
jgi:hypothetical protein